YTPRPRCRRCRWSSRASVRRSWCPSFRRTPSRVLATGHVDLQRLAVGAVDQEVRGTDVEREERAVGADADELAIGVGQLLDDPLHGVLTRVQVAREPVGLLDGGAQVGAGLGEQVGEIAGG